jgi:hypothetical protein
VSFRVTLTESKMREALAAGLLDKFKLRAKISTGECGGCSAAAGGRAGALCGARSAARILFACMLHARCWLHSLGTLAHLAHPPIPHPLLCCLALPCTASLSPPALPCSPPCQAT